MSTSRLQQADALKEAKNVEQAISSYQAILAEKADNNDQVLREQEYALVQLGQIYKDLQYSINMRVIVL